MQLYFEVNQWVEAKELPLQQFWTSDRLCLTRQQFSCLLTAADVKLTHEAEFDLSEKQFFTVEQLLHHIPYWRDTYHSVSDFLLSKQQPPHSPTPRPKSKTSAAYLKSHLQKQMQREVQLNETLLRTQQQTEYQLTLKIGEANDLAAKIKHKSHYLCLKNQSGVILYEQTGDNQKTITIKEFQKIYQKLKYQGMKNQHLPASNIPQDLKKTLLEVMCLSSKMEQQIKLIQSKGVTH